MSKMTLLEIVQNILNATDGDAVNSIGDTVESMQYAEVVKETYQEITAGIDLPGQKGLILLDATTSLDKPNELTCPADVEKIEWVRYNGTEIKYLEPEAWVKYVVQRRASEDESLELINGFVIYTDRDPEYYTSFDDTTLIFDAYNKSQDACLQQSKTLCWGKKIFEFQLVDSYVPPIPADMFPRLLAEAKDVCFSNYKQVASVKDKERARRQLTRQQNNMYKAGEIKPIDRLPNYGRKRR